MVFDTDGFRDGRANLKEKLYQDSVDLLVTHVKDLGEALKGKTSLPMDDPMQDKEVANRVRIWSCAWQEGQKRRDPSTGEMVQDKPRKTQVKEWMGWNTEASFSSTSQVLAPPTRAAEGSASWGARLKALLGRS